MQAISDFQKVYLCSQFVDMRKQINGLSQIVEAEFQLDLFDSALFVFTHRRRVKWTSPTGNTRLQPLCPQEDPGGG